MADIISDLAGKSGVSVALAKKGVGVLLSFLKEKLPAETFSNITRAVPGAESMMIAASEKGQEASSGILGTVSGLAGKFFGSAGGVSELVSKLTQLGFSAEELQRFVPNVLEFLKGKLPGDVMNKITALIPIGGIAAQPAP